MAKVFVQLQDVDDKTFVSLTHYQPQELDEEFLSTGILTDTDSFPQPDHALIEAQYSATLAYDRAAGTFYYVYATRQLSDKERIEQLEEMNKQLFATINYILGV